MNEKIKSFSVKLLLTIPAIVVGIFSAILFIFRPLVDLWYPPVVVERDPEPIPEPQQKHEFH